MNIKVENNSDFIELIESLKFKHQKTETSNQYYVNEVGNQIRVSTNGDIMLLNSRGFEQDFNYDKKEILAFSELV